MALCSDGQWIDEMNDGQRLTWASKVVANAFLNWRYSDDTFFFLLLYSTR